jgi:hypothetical protein
MLEWSSDSKWELSKAEQTLLTSGSLDWADAGQILHTTARVRSTSLLHAMKTCVAVEVQIHIFLTKPLD